MGSVKTLAIGILVVGCHNIYGMESASEHVAMKLKHVVAMMVNNSNASNVTGNAEELRGDNNSVFWGRFMIFSVGVCALAMMKHVCSKKRESFQNEELLRLLSRGEH